MYVTKRSMTAAILNLHKHLESVTEAIAVSFFSAVYANIHTKTDLVL